MIFFASLFFFFFLRNVFFKYKIWIIMIVIINVFIYETIYSLIKIYIHILLFK